MLVLRSSVYTVNESVYLDTDLASPLLEFDLDEQNEANQRHNHKESQEDAHVKIFCGLLWEKEGKRNTNLSNNLHMHVVKRVIKRVILHEKLVHFSMFRILD